MSVGLDALRIFKAKGSVEMRKKYPTIYHEDIDKSCHFNPNNDYLYAPSSEEIIKHTSPWYCFALIPNTTNEGKSSLNASLYLMQFLNWAIYYLAALTYEYSKIPKGRLKKQDKKEAEEWSEIYADIIKVFSINPEKLKWSDTSIHLTLRDFEFQRQEFTIRTFTQEEIVEKAHLTSKRNGFPLKPSYFLKLCRFFARAWYEERFCVPDNAVGSVEFAHYVSNYIKSSLANNGIYRCNRYDGNDTNPKKEVARLFTSEKKIEYSYHYFHILLEKHDNTQTQEDASYTISITQYGCEHSFYLFSRL